MLNLNCDCLLFPPSCVCNEYPSGQLHIEGLGPEQQQVFINSIKEQQAQQIHAAQMARVLPQQHLINQVYLHHVYFIVYNR